MSDILLPDLSTMRSRESILNRDPHKYNIKREFNTIIVRLKTLRPDNIVLVIDCQMVPLYIDKYALTNEHFMPLSYWDIM